jgi:hypothetical protein
MATGATPRQGMRTHVTSERAVDDVVRWRREQLVHTGFALPLATRLAGDVRYDLHALIELVEAGCPPELAVRILAPDEGGAS